MNNPTVGQKKLLQYGFIALPVAFAGFPLYVLAPDFYVTHHGLSLTYLGSLLLAIRLYDAVQDPLIGWFADRLHARFLAILAVAGFLVCAAIFALFNASAFSPAVWFAVCMVVAISAYSVLTIVLGAQATLWTEDKQDQTRIAGARESFGLIGLVIAVTMPTLLARFVAADQVYLGYSLLLAFLMLAGVWAFSRYLKHFQITARLSHQKTAQPLSLLAALKALPKESLQLYAIYGVSMLASSIPAVLVIFYVRDLLGVENLIGLFLLLYFLTGALAMGFWKNLSRRLGKYKSWCLSNILAVSGFCGAFFLGSGDAWAYGAICIVSGFALGADLTLPPSILADQIHANNNNAYAGTHYALLAFCTKFSLALASALALPALDAAGFKPQIANTQTALSTLATTYALVPSLLKLASAGLLYLFFIQPPTTGGKNEPAQNHGNFRSSHHA